MTCFEKFFASMKKALDRDDVYGIWPDFEPEYDEKEFAWTTIRGLGEVLLLNCGSCDGPSDLRHTICRECCEKRSQMAKEAYEKATGRSKDKWPALILCRIYAEQ